MNQEHVILNENGVLVSTARFVAPQATYIMANVTSLRMASAAHISEALLLVFFALVPTAIGLASMRGAPAIGGIALIGAAGLWFAAYKMFRKRTHYLFVVTNAGEVPGLRGTDAEWIRRVHDALLQAIVARG